MDRSAALVSRPQAAGFSIDHTVIYAVADSAFQRIKMTLPQRFGTREVGTQFWPQPIRVVTLCTTATNDRRRFRAGLVQRVAHLAYRVNSDGSVEYQRLVAMHQHPVF